MKVAVIQASPIWLNTKATVEKITNLMETAANNGAKLCVFGETFLPGYPAWIEYTNGSLFDNPKQKQAYAMYLNSAVKADGPELKDIAQKSSDLGIFVYLGVAEKSESQGTVYCSLAAIDPHKGLVSMHRKLMPTYEERLAWGTGDGSGLRVHDYEEFKIGGLNCWENWMPLARTAMYSQGEHIHVSVWPGSPKLTQDITRFIALEGRVYVLASGGLLFDEDIPDDFPLKKQMLEHKEFHRTGGSKIVGPCGTVLAQATDGEECIIYHDLELGRVYQARQNFDPCGHYSRSDVLKLHVKRTRLSSVDFKD